MQITQAKESTLTIQLFEKEPKPLSLKIDGKFQRAIDIINSYNDSPAALLPEYVDRFSNLSSPRIYENACIMVPVSTLYGFCGGMISVVCFISLSLLYTGIAASKIKDEEIKQMLGASSAVCALVAYYIFSVQREHRQNKTDEAKNILTINLENTWDKFPDFLVSKQSLLSLEIESLENTAKKQVESLNDPKVSFPIKKQIDQENGRIKTLITENKKHLKFCEFALAYFQGLNAERIADAV